MGTWEKACEKMTSGDEMNRLFNMLDHTERLRQMRESARSFRDLHLYVCMEIYRQLLNLGKTKSKEVYCMVQKVSEVYTTWLSSE